MKVNWGKVGGGVSVALAYVSFSIGIYFFIVRLGFRWAMSNYWVAFPVVDLTARTVMAIWSHLVCLFSDPFVPISVRAAGDGAAGASDCKKCFAVKTARTHHCSTCNRCVERMDHHCPWINKCVGLKNQKAFLLFLAYSCSAAVECLILVVVRLATCPNVANAVVLFGLRFVLGEDKVDELLAKAGPDSEFATTEPTCQLTVEYTIAGVVATVLMFFFVVFMTFISSDQIFAIVNNQTHVEVLKHEHGPKRSLRDAMIETFGMEPSMWWLVPIDWRFVGPLQQTSPQAVHLKAQ